MSERKPLRVAMIGTAFMGRAHSQAWHTAPRFFDLELEPVPVVIVGTSVKRSEEQARMLGWAEASTDWRGVVERDDIDLVDICSPGNTHAEIAIAALESGKHVLCEKPLANSVEEAERMVGAAERAFATSASITMCGFSYRQTPALRLARQFIAEGRLGAIRHVRASYLQDWLSDADAPLSWRLDRSKAGSGSLGDIGAHSIDIAQWLTGQAIVEVSATMRTFVADRPMGVAAAGLGGVAIGGAPRGPVTVDDAVAFTATLSGGALGVFEATRMATGRRNANRVEVNGDRGSVAFDFERMNELEYFDGRSGDKRAEGFRRILVTDPAHPYASNWWPTGHGLGYEHLFTHQVVDVVRAVADRAVPSPSFAEALDVQRVLAAVQASSAARSMATTVKRTPE